MTHAEQQPAGSTPPPQSQPQGQYEGQYQGQYPGQYQDQYQGVRPTTVTGWSGWIYFAAFMMLLIGILHAITGLTAIFRDQYFVVGKSGLVVTADYTAWGWIHLIGGIVVAAAGIGLLTGHLWARIIAVVVALISAIVNFTFLAAFPLWSTIVIALDVLVIWAVMVHGDEMRDA